MWPRVWWPTGTEIGAPVLRTSEPRTRPSVGFMATTRPRAAQLLGDLAHNGRVTYPRCQVELDGEIDLGEGIGRELDVDHRSRHFDDPAVLNTSLTIVSSYPFVSASAPPTIS